MADIVVTVAVPGASEGAGQIRNVGKATGDAAAANEKLASSTAKLETRLAGEVIQLKKATAAAKEYVAAIKAGTNIYTGGGNASFITSRLQGEATILSKRAQMFRQFANQARQDVANLGESSGGGSQGPGLFRRIGRGLAAGGAVAHMGGGLGQLAGVGQLGPAAIGAAAAMVTLGAAVSILGGLMTLNAERSKALADAANHETNSRRAANEQIQKQGLAAVDTQGDALLKLIGLGGSDLVGQSNKLAKDSGLKLGDVQSGVALAQQIKDQGQQAAVLQAATILAQSGQSSFADAVKTAVENNITAGGRNKIAAGILGEQTDQFISPQAIAAMIANLKSSGMASDIFGTRSAQSRGGEIGQEQIGQAVAAVMATNAGMLNPLMAKNVEEARDRQQQLDVLRRIDEGQNKFYALCDRIWSPWSNARNQRLKAEGLEAETTFAPTD